MPRKSFVEEFRSPLARSIKEKLPDLVPSGHSGFFVYEGKINIHQIGKGVAASFPTGARIVAVNSDDLRGGDFAAILDPLLKGGTLVLLCSGTSRIPARLAAYWPKFAENPHGYMAAVTEDLVLYPGLKIERAGALVVIQQADPRALTLERGVTIWPLLEDEAAELAAAGRTADIPISSVGVQRIPSRSVVSFEELCSRYEGASEHECVYRIYRDVVNRVAGSLPVEKLFVATGLADMALRTRDPKQSRYYAEYHGIEQAFGAVENEIDALQTYRQKEGGRREQPSGRYENEPLDDVYAAALSMRIGGDWNIEPERSVYRGQRSIEWRTVPSIYRPNQDGSPADIGARWQRVEAFAARLRACRPELTDEQIMAVAQHYSKEADTPTHLIDVTWDPLVALFFASDGAKAGNVGVVDHIVVPEWRKLVASETGDPGALRVIEVPRVKRIERQRACFLMTADPELFERYIPYRLWFRQVEGLTFRDPEADQPIVRELLYETDDDLAEVVSRFHPGAGPRLVLASPPPLALQGVTPERLLARAHAIEPSLSHLRPYNAAVLRCVCEVLARGAEWSGTPTSYSFHRLRESCRLIADAEAQGRPCPFETALQFTFSRLGPNERGALNALGLASWARIYPIPIAGIADQVHDEIDIVKDLQNVNAGIFFPGPPDHIEAVFGRLAADARWSFLDLRAARLEEVAAGLTAIERGARVLVAAPAEEPFPDLLVAMLHARYDRRGALTLTSGRRVPVDRASALFLVFGGVLADEVPRNVAEQIDYWFDLNSRTFASVHRRGLEPGEK